MRCGEPVAAAVIAAKAFRLTRGQDFRIRKTGTRDPAGCKVRGIASRRTTKGNGATRRASHFGLVEREAPALPVSRQCRLLAVSRQPRRCLLLHPIEQVRDQSAQIEVIGIEAVRPLAPRALYLALTGVGSITPATLIATLS